MVQIQLYLKMLLRSWWIVALTTLAAFNVALVMLYFSTPIYKTTANFVINPSRSLLADEDLAIVRGIEVLDRRSVVSTYDEVLSSDHLHQKVAQAIDLAPSDLAKYNISAVVLPDSNVLELSVEGPNPKVAAQLANAIGHEAIDFVNKTYLVYEISLLDPATPPSHPINFRPVRDIALAVVLGGILGSIVAILREHLNLSLDVVHQQFAFDNGSSAYTSRYFKKRVTEKMAQDGVNNIRLGIIHLKNLQYLRDILPPFLIERLLQEVTHLIRNELRGNDILGRWDEDSFAVMLSPASEAVATDTFERIQQVLSISIPLYEDGETISLEPRIGVTLSQNNEPVETLIERAGNTLRQVYPGNGLQISNSYQTGA